MFNQNKILLIVFALTFTVHAQIYVSAALSSDHFDHISNYSSASGFVVGLSYQIFAKSLVSFEYKNSTTSLNVATPQGSDNISTRIHDFAMIYGYNLIENFYSVNLQPIIGITVKNIYRGSYTVNLGAIGNRTINSAYDNLSGLLLGLKINKWIGDRINLSIRPQFSLYRSSLINRMFSIAGGIGVRIL